MPGKFYVEPNESATEPLPLTDLVFLEFGEDLSITPIRGADKMQHIQDALYFAFVQNAANGTMENASLMTQLAQNVRFGEGAGQGTWNSPAHSVIFWNKPSPKPYNVAMQHAAVYS